MQEQVHLRTIYGKHYKNPDGTFQIVSNIKKIHYLHSSGIYLPIDNTIRKTMHMDYDFENTANNFTVFFKANINQDRAIAFYHNEAMVYFTPVGLGWYDSAKDKLEFIYKPSDTDCVVSGHEISFNNLYPNTKAGFVVNEDGFKEFFEVNDPFNIPNPVLFGCDPESSYLVLVNHLEYDGIEDIADKHGLVEDRELAKDVYFIKDQLPHFFNPNLVGIDSTGKTTDLKKVFKTIDDHGCLIHGIDYQTLMTSPAYPYIIDTSISVTTLLNKVASIQPSSPIATGTWKVISSCFDQGLKAGFATNDVRGIAVFESLNIPSGSTIIDASFVNAGTGQWNNAQVDSSTDIWTRGFINYQLALTSDANIASKTQALDVLSRATIASQGLGVSVPVKNSLQELCSGGALSTAAFYSMASKRPPTSTSALYLDIRSSGSNVTININYTSSGGGGSTESTSSLFFAHA